MGLLDVFSGLFTPGWISVNEGKALHALEKVKGDQALCEVAQGAPLESVRFAAIKRIEDEELLKTIALKPPQRLYTDTYPVGVAAVSRLNSEDALVEVFMNSKKPDVTEYAGKRLANLYPKTFKQVKKQKEDVREDELYKIVTTDPDPTRRLEALLESQRNQTAVKALNDKDVKVCIAAIGKVRDGNAFVAWLRHGKREIPIGATQLYKKIDALRPEQLQVLAEDETVNPHIRRHACKAAGHVRGEGCVCSRCGTKMEHEFDGNKVCVHCGARLEERTEDLVESGVTWGRQTIRTLVHPDGTKEQLTPSIEKLVDESTMNWLFPSD